MRTLAMTFAVLSLLAACKGKTSSQQPPPQRPVEPRSPVLQHTPPAVKPDVPPAVDKAPPHLAIFTQVSREGAVVPDLDTEATVSGVEGDQIMLAPPDGKPLRLLLKAPDAVRPAMRADQRVRVRYRQIADAPGVGEILSLRGDATLFERANLHGLALLSHDFVDGKLKVRQLDDKLPGETVGAVTRTPLKVEIRADKDVRTASPGETVTVQVGGQSVRVWVVGSLLLTAAAETDTEADPYHLHVVVSGTTGQSPGPK